MSLGQDPRWVREFSKRSMDERHEMLRWQLSRRGLLRSAATLGAGALGAGPLLWTPTARAADAVPITARWLAYGTDPTSSMVVRAQVPAPVTDGRVRFGSDTSYGQSAPARLETLQTTLGTGERLEQYFLVAELTGLGAGQGYHYQVSHSGNSAQDAIFTTAHAPGTRTPFTFTAFGDQQVSDAAVQVEQVLAKVNPAFHVLAGDVSYADNSGQGIATDNFRPQRWDSYFRQIDSVASRIPWMIAAGNHEMEAVYDNHGYGGMLKRFTMPANGPSSCPMTWSMVYGTIAVITLDANEVTAEVTTNRGYSQDEQTRWLGDELSKYRQDVDIDFIVVVMHQCAYASSKAHGSDLGVRSAWAHLFDQYEVDLVISGHNHNYERTDPIRQGAATRKAPMGSRVNPASEGTTYVICGGGGATLNDFLVPDRITAQESDPDEPTASQYVDHPGHYAKELVTWSRARYRGFSLIAVDVDPGQLGGTTTMSIRALDAAGRTIDTVTLVRQVRSFLEVHRTEVLVGAGLGVGALAAAGALGLRARRGRGEVTSRDGRPLAALDVDDLSRPPWTG